MSPTVSALRAGKFIKNSKINWQLEVWNSGWAFSARTSKVFIQLLWFISRRPLFFLNNILLCCCLVAKSCPTLCDPMDCSLPGFPVLHYLPELAQTHVNWFGDAIQPSHPLAPFSSCPQCFPASGSFPVSRPFTSGGQSIGASASASVLPMNTQGWFSLGLTGLISLMSKGRPRVFSSTTVSKHQLFRAQFS